MKPAPAHRVRRTPAERAAIERRSAKFRGLSQALAEVQLALRKVDRELTALMLRSADDVRG